MPKYRVVTPKGASLTVAGGGYDYEKEALDPIGAEIIEAPANEAEFIAAAKTADAIYAKGMPITKAVIDALENCKVITLGSVGVDSVDVKAATARGIPVTNIPDTFIEAPDSLVGRQIIAVVNFPVKRIAGIASEVLVLGAYSAEKDVVLLQPTLSVENGSRIG